MAEDKIKKQKEDEQLKDEQIKDEQLDEVNGGAGIPLFKNK